VGRFDLIIFDCDGVLVDSELITNRVFATMIGELGVVVTLDDMFERFVGHSMAHCLALVRELAGRDLPDDFLPEYRRRSARALEEEILAVPNVERMLEAIDIPSCVASNGSQEKMRLTLGITGLLARFEPRLFSADDVVRGKPAPDVFLLAASRLGVGAERTAVIEDTPAGVTAALAAGMKPYGYAGRTPARRLRAAGCVVVFDDMLELPALLRMDPG
jgi:HAD superfamily hydrolase (TIGR01509 family)